MQCFCLPLHSQSWKAQKLHGVQWLSTKNRIGQTQMSCREWRENVYFLLSLGIMSPPLWISDACFSQFSFSLPPPLSVSLLLYYFKSCLSWFPVCSLSKKEYGTDVIMSISSRFPERMVWVCMCLWLWMCVYVCKSVLMGKHLHLKQKTKLLWGILNRIGFIKYSKCSKEVMLCTVQKNGKIVEWNVFIIDNLCCPIKATNTIFCLFIFVTFHFTWALLIKCN